ncbi:MAG: hypothetical protein ABI867_12175 [Kofleriaceae bacterium]
MLKTLLLGSITLVLTTTAARADFAAEVCMTAPNVKAITDGEGDNACAGFVATDAKGKEASRVDKGYAVSGSILATPDGRSVVMLQHYPQTDEHLETKDGIVFFRDGKQIARYPIRDLVVRMELLEDSVSHTHWVERPALVLGKTLTMTTTSQRELTFEVATGKLVSSTDTALWKKCGTLVYASDRPTAPVNWISTLAKAWVAKGTLPNGNGGKVSFALGKGVTFPRPSGFVLCLEPDDTYGWMAVSAHPMMWNRLPH